MVTWIAVLLIAPVAMLFVAGYIAALLDLDDQRPRNPVADYRVLILGYHPRLAGGVTAVTRTLLERMPEASLLPIKHCYGARGWALYAWSLVRLIGALCVTGRPLLAHFIVASRGDRVRGVAVILLCRLFSVPVCVNYHTNWRNMSFAVEVYGG